MYEIRDEQRAETRGVDNIFEMLRETASPVCGIGKLRNENATNVANGDIYNVIYRMKSEKRE